MDNVTVEDRLDPFKLLAAGIRALGDRVMLWVVLIMSFALYAYACTHQGPWTFAGATAFTVLAGLLMWRRR